MSLKFYELRKLPITSSASRAVYKFYNDWNLQTKVKRLSLYKKKTSGRNDKGRIILWTRGSTSIKRKIIKINYNLRYNRLGFISSFQIVPFKNKLLSLVYFANGITTYFITSDSHSIFSFIYLNKYRKIRRVLFKPIFLMLIQIKKLTKVSLLELIPGRGAQYARSNGASAKLIKFSKETHSVLAQLPSGVKKMFSYYSFACSSPVSLSENRKCSNTKSGYWRSFGFKSIVRGVAMNPVDHPHGGRTKAIKYQRTPWGKTTKFK